MDTTEIDDLFQLSLDDDFPPESDDGNVEYKRWLLNLTESRIDRLATQMNGRLQEGSGECFYHLGLDDNGSVYGLTEYELTQSLENLKHVASLINAKIHLVEKYPVRHKQKDVLYRAQIMIRTSNDLFKVDLKLSLLGNVDTGKSTLIGTLFSGQLDDGNGSSRSFVLQHPHEREHGQTSDIGTNIVGFNTDGELINSSGDIRNLDWGDIVRRSNKIITFTDLCGHQKYLSTTATGICGTYPDYAVLLIDSVKGPNKMTRTHIDLCTYLKIPFFILITKIDVGIERKNKLDATLDRVIQISKRYVKRIPQEIKTSDDVLNTVENFKLTANGLYTILPFIQISCKTGQGLDLFKSFLNLLPVRTKYDRSGDAKLTVSNIYSVKGVGTVVHGLVDCGTFNIKDSAWIGPDGLGKYKKTTIKDIQFKRVPVKVAPASYQFTFNLSKVDRKWIRKGMVVLSNDDKLYSVREFTAKVEIHSSNPSTIRVGYEPYIHIGMSRQNAKIVEIVDGDDILRANSVATIRFRFKFRPLYIMVGERFAFLEDMTRGAGIVTSIES